MTRKLLWMFLVGMVLAASAYGATSYSPFMVLRAKANLAASATDSSLAINCFGSKQVVFYLRAAAAEADSLSSIVAQVSNNGVNYINVALAGGTTTMSTALGMLSSRSLINSGGRVLVVNLTNGTSTGIEQYMPWSRARVLFLNGGAQVDSLGIIGWTISDGEGANDLARMPPAH